MLTSDHKKRRKFNKKTAPTTDLTSWIKEHKSQKLSGLQAKQDNYQIKMTIKLTS